MRKYKKVNKYFAWHVENGIEAFELPYRKQTQEEWVEESGRYSLRCLQLFEKSLEGM